MKLSDYAVKFLADQGVKHVFLVAGGAAMHLSASLARCKKINPICNQHEQASVMAAEAYAKVTGGLGAAIVTSGPGVMNALTGLAAAWLDSTPVIVISGQVKLADSMHNSRVTGIRQRGPQEVDAVSMAAHLTKYTIRITQPEMIRYHLEKAAYLALSGRRGPVWIDVPLDVQAAEVDESALAGFHPEELPSSWDLHRVPGYAADALNALDRSERPLILLGAGCCATLEDTGAARSLIDLLQVPVATTWRSIGVIASNDPLHVGMPGTFTDRGANFALQSCDLLLSIGSRLDSSMTAFATEKLAPHAKKIIVDVDVAEINKLIPHIDFGIHADAGAFLHEMITQVSGHPYKNRAAWINRCAEWKRRWLIKSEYDQAEGPVSVYRFAKVLARESRADDVLVSGSAGNACEMFLMSYPRRKSQRIIHAAGLGAMGCGIPNAIGACLASGRQRTICVDGDGGFQFNVQELATVRLLKLPIKFFVLNNNGYASIRATQRAYFGAPLIGCDEATGVMVPSAAAIARSYGISNFRITGAANLQAVMREVLESYGPVICEVDVIPDEERVPRVMSKQNADGSMSSGSLEDLWPFLDREELKANMEILA